MRIFMTTFILVLQPAFAFASEFEIFRESTNDGLDFIMVMRTENGQPVDVISAYAEFTYQKGTGRKDEEEFFSGQLISSVQAGMIERMGHNDPERALVITFTGPLSELMHSAVYYSGSKQFQFIEKANDANAFPGSDVGVHRSTYVRPLVAFDRVSLGSVDGMGLEDTEIEGLLIGKRPPFYELGELTQELRMENLELIRLDYLNGPDGPAARNRLPKTAAEMGRRFRDCQRRLGGI